MAVTKNKKKTRNRRLEQSGEVEKLKAEIEKLKGELQKKEYEVKKERWN